MSRQISGRLSKKPDIRPNKQQARNFFLPENAYFQSCNYVESDLVESVKMDFSPQLFCYPEAETFRLYLRYTGV